MARSESRGVCRPATWTGNRSRSSTRLAIRSATSTTKAATTPTPARGNTLAASSVGPGGQGACRSGQGRRYLRLQARGAYRGALVVRESGKPGHPLRLTSDPTVGSGRGSDRRLRARQRLAPRSTPQDARARQGLARRPRLRAPQRVDGPWRREGRPYPPGPHAELADLRSRRH